MRTHVWHTRGVHSSCDVDTPLVCRYSSCNVLQTSSCSILSATATHTNFYHKVHAGCLGLPAAERVLMYSLLGSKNSSQHPAIVATARITTPYGVQCTTVARRVGNLGPLTAALVVWCT